MLATRICFVPREEALSSATRKASPCATQQLKTVIAILHMLGPSGGKVFVYRLICATPNQTVKNTLRTFEGVREVTNNYFYIMCWGLIGDPRT